MSKRSTLWKLLGYAAVALLCLWAFVGFQNWLHRPSQPSPLSGEVSAMDHVKGPETAKVTIIEYTDFQCPACKAYAPVIAEVLAAYPNDVRVIYRNFPLNEIHPQAYEGALAAEAASKQGKYFEMHDLLFARQDEWSKLGAPLDTFLEYAQLLGMDQEQFRADYRSSEVADKVAADERSGIAANISATPTFFLNGQPMQNPRGKEGFVNAIEAALKQ